MDPPSVSPCVTWRHAHQRGGELGGGEGWSRGISEGGLGVLTRGREVGRREERWQAEGMLERIEG